MSRFGIKIFCVIAILQFVTGCISFTPAVGYDASPLPEIGYIYGRFVLHEQISSPRPSKMGLVLQEQHTDSTYTIKFKPVDVPSCRKNCDQAGVWSATSTNQTSTSVIAVKPGTYALKKLGGKSLGASPLTKPFVVDAGKAYYVADFAVQSSDLWLPGLASAYSWKVDAISDNYESTTAELKAKFPRLSLLPTARALALASGPSRPPTPEELANANYGTAISQAEADGKVWDWLLTVLKDPRFIIWTKVKKGWYQDPPSEGGRMHFVYQLFVSTNADYRFSFFNGQIVAIHKGQIVKINEQESGEYWHIDLVGSELIGP